MGHAWLLSIWNTLLPRGAELYTVFNVTSLNLSMTGHMGLWLLCRTSQIQW